MAEIAFLEKSISEFFEAAKSKFMFVRPAVRPRLVEFPKPKRRSNKPYRPLFRQQTRRTTLNEFWTEQLGQGRASSAINDEAENDLDSMVRDFIEEGFSEDSKRLSETHGHPFRDQDYVKKLQALLTVSDKEQTLYCVIESAISSIALASLDDPATDCAGSCIRFQIVNRLNLAGYRASVCKSKWKQTSNLPAGEYEFIDVLLDSDSGVERLIIDSDFRTQFSIARPVACYENLLKEIPPIFIGKVEKLQQVLQLMADAAVASLQSNAMHVPPWRTLEYMRAKWFSDVTKSATPCNRALSRPAIQMAKTHECREHLNYLKAYLEITEKAEFSSNTD
eukprot:TRINITY_DN8220_c0_g1_i1.p1 TRINITY_DN8220_c0_g1~~TRINITY_DN8220_c0_g1_i1.p1  ORF type:complete len:336 (-),score=39.29 TRINITY_DN8220_c0_g1_i1:279-1286(-)